MLRPATPDCCSDGKVRRLRWLIAAAVLAAALLLAAVEALR